jgi:hypothetical protein
VKAIVKFSPSMPMVVLVDNAPVADGVNV